MMRFIFATALAACLATGSVRAGTHLIFVDDGEVIDQSSGGSVSYQIVAQTHRFCEGKFASVLTASGVMTVAQTQDGGIAKLVQARLAGPSYAFVCGDKSNPAAAAFTGTPVLSCPARATGIWVTRRLGGSVDIFCLSGDIVAASN